MAAPRPDAAASRWAAWLAQSADALFLLTRQRRLRYVNPAFERLTGRTADAVLGLACTNRRDADPLGAALRPPREVLAGDAQAARRAVPPARSGPPWWDIGFTPLNGPDGLIGVIGRIRPVAPEAAVPAARPLAEGLMALRRAVAARYPLDLLRGDGPALERLLAQVRLALPGASPVWLVGEAGSGKFTVARVVHHNGATRERPFARLDADALPPASIHAALFGSGGLLEPGRVGTVYLTRPEALSPDLQARLADRLEEMGAAAPRLAVGSALPPGRLAIDGALHSDFFARFALLELAVPPLRDRPEDIPRLTARALERAAIAGVPPPAGVSPEAAALLRAYPWPGNLRELFDALADGTRRAAGARLEPPHLPVAVRDAGRDARVGRPAAQPFLGLDPILEQVERRLIADALRRTGGNRAAAAELLGIWRPRLIRRIEALGIEG